MNILKQMRVAQTANTTLSDLMVWSEPLQAYRHVCYLIEDTIRKQKIKGATCLFEGVHQLKMRNWGKHYEAYTSHRRPDVREATASHGIIEVFTPQFQGTLYHIGTTKDDTEGCPLPCIDYSVQQGEFIGSDSGNAYVRLMTVPYLNGLTIPAHIAKFGGTVEIINAKNLIVI